MTVPEKKTIELLPAEPVKKEFRKANSAVTVRVQSGPNLSLLGRRLFNVLLYYAQNLASPGLNAPEPFENCPNPQDFYWVPLAEIAKEAAWGSKDAKFLLRTLQQLQTTLVESDDSTGGFTSVQLIGTVYIRNGAGRRPTMVGWEFPRVTRDILSNPDFYTRLSIKQLTTLRTNGGAALYEIAKRYLTNAGGKSRKHPWQWWYDTLSGHQIGSTPYPSYRYFKRDLLSVAINDVNSTDIRVELIEIKKGRQISELQFIVTSAPKELTAKMSESEEETKLIHRLLALGFSSRQSLELIGTGPTEHFLATLELVEQRLKDDSLQKLKSPAAFFRKALKDDYVGTTAAKVKKVAEKAAAKTPEPANPIGNVPSATATDDLAQRDKALAEFQKLSATKKAALVKDFQEAAATHKRLKVGGIAFNKTLANWLIKTGFSR